MPLPKEGCLLFRSKPTLTKEEIRILVETDYNLTTDPPPRPSPPKETPAPDGKGSSKGKGG